MRDGVYRDDGEEWTLGCVNSHSAARGNQEAKFTKPITHSFAPSMHVRYMMAIAWSDCLDGWLDVWETDDVALLATSLTLPLGVVVRALCSPVLPTFTDTLASFIFIYQAYWAYWSLLLCKLLQLFLMGLQPQIEKENFLRAVPLWAIGHPNNNKSYFFQTRSPHK